jgi:hypothetical protein
MDTTERTYGIACPWCAWMIDGCPTTEHIERAFIAHVRVSHPEDLDHVVAGALAGECVTPHHGFDSTLTPSGWRTTCRACRTMIPTDDSHALVEHFLECPGPG